jgi:hypothetical protein
VSRDGQSWLPVNRHGAVFAERTFLQGVIAIDNSFLAFGQHVTAGTGSEDDPIRSASVFWQSRSN